ncbi:hypothetical protein Tco_0544177 [Tanacetum coccineum]
MKAVVAEKQAGYVLTNLTLSYAELEIQSMMDVSIHQEDLAVQRTPLIDLVILMVTEKTKSTTTPTTTQAHVQMCSTSCWKDISKRSLEVLVCARKTEMDKRLFQRTEILLKMNLPDHRIKLWWKWRYLVPVESIHSPMLTLNVFNQRHHDNQKTYNTASATLISNVMIKKSVSMPVRKSQRHMKVMLPNKDDQEI